MMQLNLVLVNKNINESILTKWRQKFMYSHLLCVVSVKFSREGNSSAIVIIKVEKHEV